MRLFGLLKPRIAKIEDDRHRQVAARKLDEMIRYCAHRGCRRQRLLAYFGERYGKQRCAACDTCGY